VGVDSVAEPAARRRYSGLPVGATGFDSAGRANSADGLRVWKPAIQQTWKSAVPKSGQQLRGASFDGPVVCRRRKRRERGAPFSLTFISNGRVVRRGRGFRGAQEALKHDGELGDGQRFFDDFADAGGAQFLSREA